MEKYPVGQFVLAFQGTVKRFREGIETVEEVQKYLYEWENFYRDKLKEKLSSNVIRLIADPGEKGMPKTDREVNRVWLHKGTVCASEAEFLLKEGRYADASNRRCED